MDCNVIGGLPEDFQVPPEAQNMSIVLLRSSVELGVSKEPKEQVR